MLLSMITLGLSLTHLGQATTLDPGHGWSIRDTLPSSYIESQITWSGFAEIGVETKLNGTLESVLEQMPKTKEALRVASKGLGHDNQEPNIQADDDDKWPPGELTMLKCMDQDLNCDVAVISHIQEGIDYLRAMEETHMCGNQAAEPGQGGQCGRISCSHNSGIWWCNDNPYHVEFPCRVFADFASKIINTYDCQKIVPSWLDEFAKGQYFDLEYGINVIVGAPEGGC